MKTTLRHALATVLLCSVASVASADNITWDTAPGTVGAGDSAITGGAGTWDLATGNWTKDAGANNIAWTDLLTDTAVFTGAGGAVTLSGPINAEGLDFQGSNYDITGSTLTLAAASTINVAGGNTATVSSIIAGAGTSLTITGAGTLNITNVGNTFTGNIVVDASVLRVQGDNGGAFDPLRLGPNAKTITLQNGGTYAGHTTTTNFTDIGKDIIVGTGGGVLRTEAQITIDDTNQLTGTGQLTKTGTGLLVLGRETGTLDLGYTGPGINVDAGTLQLSHENGLGTSTKLINMAVGTTLNLRRNAGTFMRHNVTTNGNATINVNRTSGSNTNLTHSINNLVLGGGTLTLTGNNSYDVEARGASSLTANSIIAPNSAGSDLRFRNSAVADSAGTSLNLGTFNLTVTGNTTSQVAFGTFGDVNEGAVSGSGSIILNSTNDTSLVFFTSGSSFSGGVELRRGRLIVGASSSGPSPISGPLGTGQVLVTTSTGTRLIRSSNNAGTRTIHNALRIESNLLLGEIQDANGSSGLLDWAGPVTLVGDRTLTSQHQDTDPNNNNIADGVQNYATTISGIIGESGVSSLTKNGLSDLILSGANVYSGGTTVAAGLLLVNNTTGSGTGSGGVLVNGTGILGGNGTISGPTTIAVGGSLAPGNSIDSLTINNTLSLAGTSLFEINDVANTADLVDGVTDITYGGILTVSNLGDDSGYFAGQVFNLFDTSGTVLGTFGTINLPTLPGGFMWKDFGGQQFDYATGTIEVVPEPTTLVLGALGLVGLVVARRRLRK